MLAGIDPPRSLTTLATGSQLALAKHSVRDRQLIAPTDHLNRVLPPAFGESAIETAYPQLAVRSLRSCFQTHYRKMWAILA